MSDVPAPLVFVDPDETEPTYRVMLWAAPGEGKSVAAASAPGPVLVLSADRPSAYRFARKHHAPKEIAEVRYANADTLDQIYRLLQSTDGARFKTLVVDPIGSVYDHLVDSLPARADGEPNWQAINKKVLGFVKSLRVFDINVILVAHEKLSEGKRGDGKLYPEAGGPKLTQNLLKEMDIVARIGRYVKAGDEGEPEVQWFAQLQPVDNLVCKEGTGVLGDRRIADLTRWFEVANEALLPDTSDVPIDGLTDDPDTADLDADDGAPADVVDQGTLDEAAAA